MKSLYVFVLLCLSLSVANSQIVKPIKIESGVSKELAKYRKALISDVKYDISLQIPASKTATISATETIEFNYSKSNDSSLQLDFKTKSDALQSISVNGNKINSAIEKEHVLIPGKLLKSGSNNIQITFVAGDAALNRRDDYLYTLFVPDRARTMFPCFDQPDIKARFSLSLSIPKNWNAIANGKFQDSIVNSDNKTFHFSSSDILPTYLFSFAAGNFKSIDKDFENDKIQLLYRENDTLKIKNSLDSIFQLYTNSVKYYEKWTGVPYPFQKHGMVAIPDFQFGGMEHPGAILFQNGTLFLDKNATQSQINTRSNLIAHEVAHQWFGDMVTMQWFTDVWMKEVFANFMADKSTGALSNKSVYNLKFLTSHFPSAYAVDRTLGANPIRQPLDNLQNAGMLYGSIIYDKAPIMMRQLELLVGEENFRKGVSDYLKKYAYNNASWPDLIACLEKYTKEDLQSWNKVWVNETGRPIINYTANYKNEKIKNFVLTQTPEFGKERKVWKQKCNIELYYKDSIITKSIQINDLSSNIKELENLPKPLFILLNASGLGYGVFKCDTASMLYFANIKDPVSRASAYISFYENMLNQIDITPQKYLQFLLERLDQETTELDLRLICNYINTIYWEFTSSNMRSNIVSNMESTIWNAMEKQQIANNKKILFECYENIFQSQNAYAKLFDIWNKQVAPTDVHLNDEDYTSLSLALALRSDNNDALLSNQLKRIKNEDRQKRFKIITKAVSSNKETRKEFFNSLSQKENRTNESAIGASLFYLHHPLRQNDAIQYLPQTLNLLEEIQKTGDIFFPDNWLRSIFTYYQQPQAMQAVQLFLQQHQSNYNPVLRNKILQATDNLRRSQTIKNK